MNTDKKLFFLKLIPPRSSFMSDMTDDEKITMQKHISYWAPYVEDGTMVVMGPVYDPEGGYGIGVIRVESEEQLRTLIANDPANGLNSYEISPMRAVTKFSQEKQ
jgi:uncharacterized protein